MMAAGKQSSSHFLCPHRRHICKHFRGLAKFGRQLATGPDRVDSTNSSRRRFSLAGCFSNSPTDDWGGAVTHVAAGEKGRLGPLGSEPLEIFF